ncbi:MAG: hypothetical protein HC851_16925 [Acaryochloris sp. RU_4_1]|nr:hypothetical protein [Acaryochloris sp. RU_4_1]NJR55961.1 hypothetical protein [Acaryochloris sp. CRU_2_0]
MTITRVHLNQELDELNNDQLKQVTELIAFIKFRSRFADQPKNMYQFAALYQEFAQEDRELAEAGIDEYAKLLARVEQKQEINGE